MTGELLLELLSEEIPARMQLRAIDELTGLIGNRLKTSDIPAARITGYVTPRRLVVVADGIPARQPDREEERRGPRVGAPEAAIGGFLRSAGLKSPDELEVRGEFYFAVARRPGRATAEVLPELIIAAMSALSWPKSMRYPASSLRWVRPLNSVVCLFGGEVVNLPLGAVPVGRMTRGHRFLAPGEIAVAGAADYRAKLAKASVVLDWRERRRLIETQLTEQVAREGLRLKDDPALLDEVTGLVEFPVVLAGSIDDDFVRPLPDGLPPEVLATAMRMHQKYFSCLKAEPAPAKAGGTPASRFLFVANNRTQDGGKTIVAGNERVLRARLSDARFFWDQDRRIRLEDRIDALKQRVYHEKLGSVFDKVERMEALAAYLAEHVPGADKARCIRAARLAKADLSTGMVGEFPELQGVMGRYYALNDGEDPRVADAIADHYKPLGPNDTCPAAPDSIVVALADKIDALYSFYSVGEEPTGSRDPYALRRAAQGIIRLILENRLRLSLFLAFDQVDNSLTVEHDEESGNATLFVLERLKVHLKDQGVGHDLINSVRFPSGKAAEDDLVRLLARIDALRKFLGTDDGTNLLTAYRRASNIVDIEERRDNCSYDEPFDFRQPQAPEETRLYQSLNGMDATLAPLLAGEDFGRVMRHLATLRQPVDEFFESVTVNVPEKETRENRLRLLARIRATMNQIADFSQIEG